MKCIRFDVCKSIIVQTMSVISTASSMKCIRFDVCKRAAFQIADAVVGLLNEVHTF